MSSYLKLHNWYCHNSCKYFMRVIDVMRKSYSVPGEAQLLCHFLSLQKGTCIASTNLSTALIFDCEIFCSLHKCAQFEFHFSYTSIPFSNITSIHFWFHNNSLGFFLWNLYLKIDGCSYLILFSVKDQKQESMITIMDWFHQKMMELMLDNGLL